MRPIRPKRELDEFRRFIFWFVVFSVLSLFALLGISLTALFLSIRDTDQSCIACVNGSSTSIVIGNTTTVNCTETADVINIGTDIDAILNFIIPEGCPGSDGVNGTNGVDGINGTNGVDGTNGTNGVYGTNVYSASVMATQLDIA